MTNNNEKVATTETATTTKPDSKEATATTDNKEVKEAAAKPGIIPDATADIDGIKWQFDHLNRPLKNVLPERAHDAELAVLYFAKQYVIDGLEKSIDKLEFVTVDGKQVERALTGVEFDTLMDLKIEKTRVQKLKDAVKVEFEKVTADFTSKDWEVVKLVAWGNIHATNADNSAALTFGKPKHKVDKTSVDTLTGYTALLSALELYKETMLTSVGKNVKKAVTEHAVDALQAFFDYVYNVNNERDGAIYHSAIFADGIDFRVNLKVFKYIESLTCFKLTEKWNNSSERTFSGDFWKSITTYLYHLYTYGNDEGFRYTAPAKTAAMIAAEKADVADAAKEAKKAADKARRAANKAAKDAENKPENKPDATETKPETTENK